MAFEAESKMVDEHWRAIGKLAVTFSWFDSTVNSLISLLLPVTGQMVTDIVLSMPDRIHILESLAEQRLSKDAFAALKPLLEKAKSFPPLRNEYLHSVWGYLDVVNKKAQPMLIKTRGKEPKIPKPVSIKEIDDLSMSIGHTTKGLQVLILAAVYRSENG